MAATNAAIRLSPDAARVREVFGRVLRDIRRAEQGRPVRAGRPSKREDLERAYRGAIETCIALRAALDSEG